HGDAETGHASVECLPTESEVRGGAADHAVGAVQRLLDLRLLGVDRILIGDLDDRRGGAVVGKVSLFETKIRGLDLGRTSDEASSLYPVLELPDVPRPIVLQEGLDGTDAELRLPRGSVLGRERVGQGKVL